jgi:outer membrane protein OmpA-like peptidoglycan-associated protein
MPCLSYAPRPPWIDVNMSVHFAADADSLDLDFKLDIGIDVGFSAGSNLDLAQMTLDLNGPAARVRVRGHADATEQDPEALSRRRAQAVAAWLIDHRIAAEDIEIEGVGARMPIVVGPDHIELNRRVDFVVLPK